MTEIENLKASAALWVNAASTKIDEFMLSFKGADRGCTDIHGKGCCCELRDLNLKLLSETQADLQRARKFLIIADDQDGSKKLDMS